MNCPVLTATELQSIANKVIVVVVKALNI